VKSRFIPITGREGLLDIEIPCVLDNRFTDGGDVASLTRRPRFTPKEDSRYSFLLEAEWTPGL
jgi:hypothetical protein